ncbi:MAG: LytTR family DNA-binding domain-containing protein [Treponema sp.]|jgi:DNA-binding LytR/AlgR family response regulator|nr:LytTR family DNA-binding domain-containing protein [Treponema sp.]
MNILICDDIDSEVQNLEKAIKASDFKGNIICFNKGADALSCLLSEAKIDVCFLDVLMPQMDGITLARKMRGANYRGEIVFLTTTKEYAVDSYDVKAYSYLLKPPNAAKVAQILKEIESMHKAQDTAGITVTTKTMKRFLFFHEISFVEVMGKKVYFRLLDGGDIEIYTALYEILPVLLADSRFVQCHRSFVVNLDAVLKIQGKEVFFRCGKKAPIARNNTEFDKQYIKWVFGKGEMKNNG